MQKRLYRSRTDKMMGGVAGGLAEYFEVDPVIIRAVFIISTLAWGISLLAYIVLWIIVPVNPVETVVFESEADKSETDKSGAGEKKSEEIHSPVIHQKKDKKIIFGFILIAVGVFIIMDNFFPFIDLDMFIAIMLIGIGIYLLFKNDYDKKRRGHENG